MDNPQNGTMSPEQINNFNQPTGPQTPQKNNTPTTENVNAKKPITFWRFFLNLMYNTITVSLYIGLPFMIGVLIIIFTKYYNEFAAGQDESIIVGIINSTPGMILYSLISLAITALIMIGVYQDMNKDYQVAKDNYKKVIGFLAIILAVRVFLSGFSIPGLVSAVISFGLFYWLMNAKFVQNKAILENKFLTLKRGIMFAVGSFAVGILMAVMY